MKAIETSFTQKGFQLTQLKREGLAALYRKTKKGFSFESFEVVILKRNPPFMFHGKPCGDCESYPRSEQWGTFGWTFSDEDDAVKKFREAVTH